MNLFRPGVADRDERCSVCGRVIVEGHWFARVHRPGPATLFCCPHCVELFLTQNSQAPEGLNAGDYFEHWERLAVAA